MTLYFGCWGGTGHFLRRPDGSHAGCCDSRGLDGPYCPQELGRRNAATDERQPQGLARLTQEPGLTVLSFWDRTVDSRGGSHSTFLLPPGLDFEGAVAAALDELRQHGAEDAVAQIERIIAVRNETKRSGLRCRNCKRPLSRGEGFVG